MWHPGLSVRSVGLVTKELQIRENLLTSWNKSEKRIKIKVQRRRCCSHRDWPEGVSRRIPPRFIHSINAWLHKKICACLWVSEHHEKKLLSTLRWRIKNIRGNRSQFWIGFWHKTGGLSTSEFTEFLPLQSLGCFSLESFPDIKNLISQFTARLKSIKCKYQDSSCLHPLLLTVNPRWHYQKRRRVLTGTLTDIIQVT